jgi:hypothetical protein
MDWKTIERPGYFGDKRNELYANWNKQFGNENWRIAWQWGGMILERRDALQIYEDGYYEFLKSDRDTLNWLITSASNVYDTAPSNVAAGLSYDVQETPNNHLHDVAIRRAVLRTGNWFSGDRLIEIRSTDKEGWKLSPCMVPFHLPELISKEPIKDYRKKGYLWWEKRGVPDSIEAFYQRNKLLQTKID